MGRTKIDGARVYFNFDQEKTTNECKVCGVIFKTNHHGTLEKHLAQFHKLEATEVAKRKMEKERPALIKTQEIGPKKNLCCHEWSQINGFVRTVNILWKPLIANG
jgi:hypothetical protein